MEDALSLKDIIERAAQDADFRALPAARDAAERAVAMLDRGELRVAEPNGEGGWTVNAWVKQSILLYFQFSGLRPIEAGAYQWFDKIPLKTDFASAGVRAVPPATARYGSFVERGAILMPSYVNIGAWVGAGTMVDTWATVGSCAQIGRGVHLSGGVGIGGVLEPASAQPVIVEDGAFVGSRAIVVEGVRVGTEAVLAANVVLTASTPIIDVTGAKAEEYRGFVPPRAVVVPGTRAKEMPAGTIQLACAYIIGFRNENTDRKVSLNQALREFDVSA